MRHERQIESSTVIVDRYRRTATLADPGANQYKGLRIHALAGLHTFVGDLASRYLTAGGRVLDTAAGSGAMSLRLKDLGFGVESTDYVEAGFKLHGVVPFTQIDLNADFSGSFEPGFDAIVASEVIEHLENPRHFLRHAYHLLRPGGRMILSTPNVDSMASRVLYLTTGRPLWFGEQQYRSDGHITPLSQWQVDAAAQEVGFNMLERTSFGNAIERLVGSPRLQWLVRGFERLLAGRLSVNGEILVVVLERPVI